MSGPENASRDDPPDPVLAGPRASRYVRESSFPDIPRLDKPDGAVATVMEGNAEQLDANDCSRLAWLHLNLARPGAAKRAVRRGCDIDEDKYNIVNLAERLEIV